MASIFDLPLTPMSESVHTSTTELLNPGNVNVAFEISWIFCIEAEIWRCFISTSGFGGYLDLRLTPTLHSVCISPVVFHDHTNAGLVSEFPLVPELKPTFSIPASGL